MVIIDLGTVKIVPGSRMRMRMRMQIRAMQATMYIMMMTMSIDLHDHCTLPVFCPILPYVQAATVGPEKL